MHKIKVGSYIRDYYIEEQIGEGGMGFVYQVRHRSKAIFDTQGYRVLKIRKPQRDAALFEQEAIKGIQITERSPHPNIAKVFDFYSQDDLLAILMEYIDGESLQKQTAISKQRVLELVKPICSALDHIHKNDIVHLDIKPDNIRLHSKRGPVLLDFGIAQDISSDFQISESEAPVGTIEYISPEQLSKEVVTGKTDQYAVAMMVYYWLGSRFPWAGRETKHRIVMMKLGGLLPALCTVAPSISKEVSDVVMRGLCVHPQERFSTCSAFCEALEKAVLNGENIGASVEENPINNEQPYLKEDNPQESVVSPDTQKYLSDLFVDPNLKKTHIEGTFNPPPPTLNPSSSSPFVLKIFLCILVFLCCAAWLYNDLQTTIRGDGYVAYRIPVGSMQMGCSGEGCRSDEQPEHTVHLTKEFFMMRSEVSQRLYLQVMGENPSEYKNEDAPVTDVSWIDAIVFLNKLSVREKRRKCYDINGNNASWIKGCNGWRLPTEAEWEYAAHGGEDVEYAGGNNLEEVAWYGYYDVKDVKRTSVSKTVQSACLKAKNGYGLCDMSGNAKEWCWDWYDNNGYTNSQSVKNPKGPEKGKEKVLKGGSWEEDSTDMVLSRRTAFLPNDRTSHAIGFRAVISP